MKVINYNDVPKKNMTEEPLFEGGEVFSQMLITKGTGISKDIHVGVMTFEPGGTTKLHTHDFEQVLYVISGKGRVATETEEFIVTPGTIIFIPEGENHAHGATKDSQFIQLTIMNAGKATVMHRM